MYKNNFSVWLVINYYLFLINKFMFFPAFDYYVKAENTVEAWIQFFKAGSECPALKKIRISIVFVVSNLGKHMSISIQ